MENSTPTLNDMARILNDCVIHTVPLLRGDQMVLPQQTRLVIHETVLAFPDYAAKWISYVMGFIAWQEAIADRDRKALKDDLQAARDRIAQLEQELAHLKGEQGA